MDHLYSWGYVKMHASTSRLERLKCLLGAPQDAQEFAKKVNNSGGNFELFVYDDAGHAFLTAESHRESKCHYIQQCHLVPPCRQLPAVTTVLS